MTKPEIFELVSTISYVLTSVFFVLTVFFALRFKIWAVIGDLTGRTARKSIERMRKANELQRNKDSRTDSLNGGSGKAAENMQDKRDRRLDSEGYGGNLVHRNELMPETGLLSDSRAISDTGHLQNGVIIEEGTGLLQSQDDAPPIMTTRLQNRRKMELTMINDIILIHTDEVIA